MADPRRPGLQLFDQLFPSEEQNVQNAGLKKLRDYLEQGGSILSLVAKGVQGMVRDEQVSPQDAKRFLYRANSMATFLRRQYIECTLGGGNVDDQSGFASLVDGPTFEVLFKPNFNAMCPPDALESLASPVAYLMDLLRWLVFSIEPDRRELSYAIDKRRPDLMPQMIDFNAVYQSVSSVEIIVRVLETFINEHRPVGQPGTIEDALIEARYPNGLPYYQHWVTLDGIAGLKKLSVGDFAQTVDLVYPYFLRAQLQAPDFERALAHASRLGPYQRKLLTEPGPDSDRERLNQFYLDNFGTTETKVADLGRIEFFAKHTKLDTQGIERLLSIRDFAPVRTRNEHPPYPVPEKPESGLCGSVYINAHSSTPIDILRGSSNVSVMHRLSVAPIADFAAFDRMNRMIRLCNWLELPSDQVDAVLAAAMSADVRGGAENDWWITPNVVHALGLFQTLRERYNCTAAEFAAFVDHLSIYGRGEALSQFDQLFNSREGYAEPLKLNDGVFPVTPEPGQIDLTINRLCEGLGIDLQTYQYLAMTVARAHGVENNVLSPSLPILSSFYRLTRLPRMLGIKPVEGVLMLSLLGADEWLNGLAGEPRICNSTDGAVDVLKIIGAMQAFVQWCNENKLEVTWVMQHLAVPQPASEVSEQDRQLFDQIRGLLPTAQLTNATVLMAGVPPAGAASWLDFLATEGVEGPTVIDRDGLVLAAVGTPQQYLIDARVRIDWAVRNALGDLETDVHTHIVDTLLTLLVDARDAQVSLVKETLAVYAGVGVDLAIPVLNWANSTVYDLLRQVSDLVDPDEQSLRQRPVNTNAGALRLAEIRRLGDVAAALRISAATLQEFLDYGHQAWLDQSDKHAFSVSTLYGLMTLTRVIELRLQPEQELLDYLRDVNELPPILGADAKRLAQQVSAIRLAGICGLSVQEVLECVHRVAPQMPILKNLTQLDLLMRVRELSAKTGMDALTIFQIGNLPEDVDNENRNIYAEAAELALLSESGSRPSPVQVSGAVKQLVSTESSVVPTEIVAGSEQTATYTVWVKDADGTPLSGVRVNFRASLGTVEASADTNTDGAAKFTYTPGTTMGTDIPVYWLDLFEPENAWPINLISDRDSLGFVLRLRSPVPSGVVPKGQEVELYATLQDTYKNLGKDEIVDWGWSTQHRQSKAQVRPSHMRTNQEGLTRVFVSSLSGGTYTFSVICQKSAKVAIFGPIEFEGGGPAQ
ncbi:Ig-like domain-containing protein [Pseudomonas baetica]|uniref:Tc toxin subunit A n=1 Tax=Pseudomonas baetica TaxID=674054 RepID=UPI001C8BE98F|nr:Tc toxin subunit A [Pseudomonas baetica]MBX9406101.1 Ig-like domain-containing protein [Pseudomonas baetica]